MKGSIADPRVYLQIISIVILIGGLASALWIYERAGKGSPQVLGYEEENGQVYPVNPENSKAYERSMELYGGKANVLADQLRRWFLGLWHGTSLAIIVAAVSILASFGFNFAANHRGSSSGPGGPDKPPWGEPGL